MVEGGIPFPMLSDSAGKVGKVYGIYDEEAGVETRGRFLIDPDGVIQAFEILTPPVGRNVAEAIRQIQAFQLLRESKGTQAHSIRLAARQATAQAGGGPSGQRLEGMEDAVGL